MLKGVINRYNIKIMKNICDFCFDYFEFVTYIIYDLLCESEKKFFK
jgi:hypothetical protein